VTEGCLYVRKISRGSSSDNMAVRLMRAAAGSAPNSCKQADLRRARVIGSNTHKLYFDNECVPTKIARVLPPLAGRAADPHRPHPCEVANSVAVFRELSWLTRRMAKVKLDRKAAGLRLAHLLRLRIAIGLDLLN
jgi:hypothetical protein